MRGFFLVPVILLSLLAVAKDNKIAPELLKAKTVKVKILPGNFEHVGTYSPTTEDRAALNDVKDELRRWGRWRIVNDGDPSDLVALVRHGKRGEVETGAVFPGGRVSSGGSDVTQSQHVGAAVGWGDDHERAESGMIDQQPAPKYDIIAVFSPKDAKSAVYVGGGKIIHGKPLWLLNEEGALRSTIVPGVSQLRKDLEKAETAMNTESK